MLKTGWRYRVRIPTWVMKPTSNEHWVWALFLYAGCQGRDHTCKCVIHEGSIIGIYLSRTQWRDIKATSTDEYFRPKDFFVLSSICHIRFSLPWLYDLLWCHIMAHILQMNTFSFKTIKELKSLHCQICPRQGEENLKEKCDKQTSKHLDYFLVYHVLFPLIKTKHYYHKK